MCTLTTLALDPRLTRSALRKCASQTMPCHSSLLSLSSCIDNIIVLFGFLSSVYFFFSRHFSFFSFFLSWFMYGEDVGILSYAAFIFIGIVVYYGNGALKHVISRGHIIWNMLGGKVTKGMP